MNDDPRPWDVKVVIALFQLHDRLERRFADVLSIHGLTLAQFDVLMTLCHGDGITQQELAERLLVTKANVVGLIDRIAAAGWVERRPDPEDRRVNRLFLTTAGRKIAADANPSQWNLIGKLFAQLNESELKQLHALLGRVATSCKE